ncbi:AbrB/MazE/SpoVT family DNA-binding domain-containing protein [Parasphingorhabdus halotolerans]|uniref:AbrB/MazE/SpoVT family DNA-binding domain-containing protein n=1 Tax=Parasphingorhabdus halotolerans TaxID=2725558 RepID=A0A6H2DQL5_9SPHN|nr:AbrB/MazE/SpoVT family DNA-binding domain-containing protein [Parasphingorhabdus halotolerans]QJB70624.1 AbrB/MazE/SpoVT family DNA-binding domain-containing protein [Parasphingorhabdus halotolerans]
MGKSEKITQGNDKNYRGKVFKSGNSVALRLPKALGIKEGTEMILREVHGRYIAEPVPNKPKKLSLDGLYGSIKGIKRLPFEQKSRSWSEQKDRNG